MKRLICSVRRSTLLLLALITLAALSACSSGSMSSAKTTLFVNGSIYVDAETKVSTLLVRDGVVADIDVDPDAYPNAEIVDLNGAAAYPGFNDSHAHLLESGFFAFYGANLSSCDETKPDFSGNLADCIADTLRTYLATHPATQIIIGGGSTRVTMMPGPWKTWQRLMRRQETCRCSWVTNSVTMPSSIPRRLSWRN